jgi:hypothetical protein
MFFDLDPMWSNNDRTTNENTHDFYVSNPNHQQHINIHCFFIFPQNVFKKQYASFILLLIIRHILMWTDNFG